MVAIAFKRLHPDAVIPEYKTKGAAGADVHAVGPYTIIHPGEIKLIPLGFAVAIAEGFEIQVRPRSGLAVKGITVMNTPGTVDSDFRGELKVILVNLGREPFGIYPGDRIAQIVVHEVFKGHFVEVSELSLTDRGLGGFGSTGV